MYKNTTFYTSICFQPKVYLPYLHMLIKYDPCRNGIKADARSCKILKDFYISKINPMCQNAKNSYFYTNKVFKSLLICRNIKNMDPRFATANTNILPLNKNPSESAQTLVSAFKHCTQSNFFFSYLLMVSLSLGSTNNRLSAGDSRLRDPNSLLQSSQWKAVVLVAASLLVSALP